MADQTADRAVGPVRRVVSGPSAQGAAEEKAPAAAGAQKRTFSPQDVADPPKLADGVVLSGQMEESAFVEEPALIQKDGRFIQLTELLFQIVKHVDGKTSIEDIAAAASKEHGKQVSADDVRTLIAAKLMPIGIVTGADGTAAASKTPRSPLQLHMKMAMVSPAALKAVTFVLQGFFLPFIVIPLLAIAFAVLGWVFLVHGVASSVHDAFYTPGLLLVTFGIIVVSAAFHELGHASGLRAGGKLPRAMGAGLYLVYPAFYTDVSENYRLKRWARVRTDLGGFYFNLIFAVVVVGLYLVSGWEYLLFIVALVCLEIIHQLLPFVRLDGYWVLADMLGVPDFFSQMGAFLRSVLPFHMGAGRKLPRMRWWAKIAFGLYMIVVLPLLAFMLFLMVKGFPRIVATAKDASGQLIGQLGEAFGKGDLVLVAAIVLQLVFIALPTIGIALIIFNLARSVVLLLWRWGHTSPARATVTAVAAAAAIAVLLFLWVPQLGVTVAGIKSGGLASQVGPFEPVKQGEQGGTLGQAAPVFDNVLRGLNISPAPSGSPTPSPSPSATPTGTPTSTPDTTSTVTPATAAPFVPPPTPAPTPVPTQAPTPTPTPAPTTTP